MTSMGKLTIEEMQHIAKSRSGKCLSETYLDSHSKLKWQCKEGHIWEAVPFPITKGVWCPYCAHNVRLTIEEMRQLAESRGGKCLSKKYFTGRTKLKWQCKEGHVWEAAPYSVKFGNWCKTCGSKSSSIKRSLNIETMQKIAELRGGRCLSDKYATARKNLRWQCKEGHVWEATPDNIKGGTWCSICSQRISERVCRKYFESMFNNKFLHIRPEWLTTPNGARLELDGYCEELKLAFEYQGHQHYRNVKFFNTMSLERRKYYDKLKKKLCTSKGVMLIYVPYTIELGKIGKYIIEQCEKNGIEVPRKDVHLESFEFRYPENIKELQEIAKSKGGNLLSKTYINNNTKLKWQCKEGHIWEAVSSSIKQGCWCPYCSHRVKLTIEEMQSIAQNRNGKCLSETCPSHPSKLRWQCEKGHIWEANSNNIKKGKWCPYCSHRVKLTIEEMRDLAKSRDGECLSKIYYDNRVKLKWQCKDGHVWLSIPHDIKRGTWCPYCIGKYQTIKDMQQLAKRRGGRCLSNKYTNSQTKIKWQCKEGHEWSAVPNSIKSGSWCPICSRQKKKKNRKYI